MVARSVLPTRGVGLGGVPAAAIAVEIVRKLPDQVGFQMLPRRWVVERFFAWVNRNRRLAEDFEDTIASATAFLYEACVMLAVADTLGQGGFFLRRSRLSSQQWP